MKQLVGHNKGQTLKVILKTLQDLGYYVQYAVLNALDYGLPQKRIRLISGRNSPVYSYGETIDVNHDPNDVGGSVLEIWNERVSAVREKYQNLRTVVLVKSHGSQFTIIEQVPEGSLQINIRQPQKLNKLDILKAIGFDTSWVKVTKREVR